jgi:hypothetical protein
MHPPAGMQIGAIVDKVLRAVGERSAQVRPPTSFLVFENAPTA